jgi:NAD(P)-dependent dehydrogenase (short-subunit alcohol dehydrogenase family)
MLRKRTKRSVCLITGAGTRIGRALAEGLADDACDVILHCRRSHKGAEEAAALIRKKGRCAAVLTADLRKEKDVLRLAKEAEAAFGHVDLLINSAAVFYPTPPEKLSLRELEAFLDVNFKAPWLLCSVLGPKMKKRGTGLIVNIDCLSADKPWPQYLPYSISKAALRSLTLGLAQSLAPEVRVNGIAPGTILPPMKTSAAERRKLAQAAPLKRIGSPTDVLLAVRYLLQAEFVTGQILYADGGRRLNALL